MTGKITTTKAFMGELTQAETNYVALSTNRAKACANCRWCLAGCNDCYIVEDYPEPILVTGYCDRWEANPPPPPDPIAEMAETIVEAIVEVSDIVPTPIVSESAMEGKSWLDRIKGIFQRPSKPDDDAFTVFKGNDGNWYWHSIHTNNYEDREGEIITQKAHDDYIMRVDMGIVPLPVLMAWHTPGTEHGQADFIWRNDHFVHAVGHFDETPLAQKAIEFYRKNVGKIKMSHGFTTPANEFDGKHYKTYNTVEITTLPPFAAANPYTSFEEIKVMSMNPEKRLHLVKMFGEETVQQLEAADGDRSKALDELKVTYKDFATVTPDQSAPPTGDADQVKALSIVYTDIVKSQSEMLDVLKTSAIALQSTRNELETFKAQVATEQKAWQGALDGVLALLNQAPSRASSAPSTIIKESDKMTDALPVEDPVIAFLGGKVKSPAP